ncbi:MAG: cyclopropane-fatty-acyl-phospholipid synthase family protein [Acidimicrobiia bacterium]|nr:cyclopropane-fatty-acyl-phospholipid synthase family protein [Acidimicrobiia bacterium]
MDASEVSRRALDLLAKLAGHPVPRVRLWDEGEWGPPDATSTIALKHPGALRSMLLPPNDLSAGEAYVFDDVDFEGDIFAILEFGARLAEAKRGAVTKGRLLWLLRQLPEEIRRDESDRPGISGKRHSPTRDRKAVTHHYDTGNDFFAQFLDPAMVYSCAHFLSPTESLEEAQRRKLDLVCRKLRLVPEMRLLDVGCGWGALVIHAAREYGVRATGITLSGEQAAEARRRVEEAGVGGRVEILERDYRDLSGEFDAIASIGMVEHVGRKELVGYFEDLRKVLAPGGQILNHGIVTRDRKVRRVTPTFVNTYVFPDGELVPLDTVAGSAEDAGLEVRDAESLRASYALTLRHWVANLERNREAAVAAAGEKVYRVWRAYMAGSAVAFERAAISVYQLLLSDPARPWTYGRSELLASDDG